MVGLKQAVIDKIRNLAILGVRITPKTSWIFVTLDSESGLVGLGEATLTMQDQAVTEVVQEHAHQVIGTAVSSLAELAFRLPFLTLPEAAFSSAVMQAVCDLSARSQNVSLAATLGDVRHFSIPLYANINRRTLDRSPHGFGASAADAIKAGFQAIKIAPFDGITPTTNITGPTIETGLRRIEAVRAAIGADVRLMVDCYWRFDYARATKLIDAVNDFDLYWLECPIAETSENLPALRLLRSQANAHGIRLAGCETAILRRGFEPYLKAGAYDVIMPDVKYAGGPQEMLEIAANCKRYGVDFSPHNPSGPICHAASLQVCAAVEHVDMLEYQYDETPLFNQLASPQLPAIVQGIAALPTGQTGIGVSLDKQLIQTLEITAAWSTELT